MADTGRDHLPLKDVVLCSTSLPQDVRTRLADIAQQMGATHKLDLTGEVTHLIVGDIDTPKYKYVAKERPDIAVLDLAWIDAVRDAWIDGGDVDVEGLERMHRYPTFSGLKICITGIGDQTQRNHLSSKIEHEGAEYHGDLTKQVTHLLVATPEGAKYRAAKDWKIHAVSLKWLHDSVQRGMALDPRYYDPTMSEEEQGKGAYRKEAGPRTSLGKRLRNEEPQVAANENGKRKLRRHASRRLEDHSQDMWQDISAADTTMMAPSETNQWTAGDENSQLTLGRPKPQAQGRKSIDAQESQPDEVPSKPEGLFSGWCIAIQGFEKEKAKRLTHYLEPNGAQVVRRSEDLHALEGGGSMKRCLLVPHAQPSPNAYMAQAPPGVVTATEWWVERCIHYKQVLDPEVDVLSQPLWDLNILGFSKLTVSTTGFSGVDYRQVAEAIKLAGATYQEQLIPTTSALVSGTSTVKKEKAYYASKHGVPVVTAEWLWTCLKTKRKTSFERYKVELPKPESHNATSRSSVSSPVPSDTLKRSSSLSTKKDTQAQIRLSNTRKRQNTPSLPLQAPKVGPNVPKAGPFVHEDEDDEDEDDSGFAPPAVNDEHGSNHESSKAGPLRSISPNASPRKSPSIDHQKPTPPAEEGIYDDISTKPKTLEKAIPLPTNDEALSNPPPQPPTRPQADWTADLASLVERQQQRTTSSEHHTPAQRLKHRKLGRASSGSSLSHRTTSGSTAVNPEPISGESFSDSLDSPLVPQEELPSTQIGYETLEAEAARAQMAKRMGTSYSDEGTGTRLASLGTVRDSAGPATAPGGRARNRAKK